MKSSFNSASDTPKPFECGEAELRGDCEDPDDWCNDGGAWDDEGESEANISDVDEIEFRCRDR